MAEGRELDAIRGAMRAMLDEYIKAPFFWLREADIQGALAARLQTAIPDAVEIGHYVEEGSMKPAEPYIFDGMSRYTTSRVHREIKVTSDGRSARSKSDSRRGSSDATDVVVLRDAKVSIVRYGGAAFNATAHMFSRDVLAAVEIKHDHTASNRGRQGFVRDLIKLMRVCSLGRDGGHPHGFFLGIDTSMHGKNTAQLVKRRGRRDLPDPNELVDWSVNDRLASAGLRSTAAKPAAASKAIVESYDLRANTDGELAVRHLHWFRTESR